MSSTKPTQPGQPHPRTLRDRDRIKVKALGVRRMVATDSYHQLMQLSWLRLSILFVLCFVGFNLVFAALYHFDTAGLSLPAETAGIAPFWREFFFSVHTVATIGYGNIYPISLYANIMVVIEITLGILFFALTTGIAFARFSRPTARIVFSNVLVVRQIDGVPMLMFRAANQRHNLIYSAQARVSLLDDENMGGTVMRRFVDLKLVHDSNPAFALTWTVMHPIDDESPLRIWLEDKANPVGGEILVVLSGFDESSGQSIHGRWAYGTEDIRFNSRFVDILGFDESGARTINYDDFHATENA